MLRMKQYYWESSTLQMVCKQRDTGPLGTTVVYRIKSKFGCIVKVNIGSYGIVRQ